MLALLVTCKHVIKLKLAVFSAKPCKLCNYFKNAAFRVEKAYS